MCKKIIVAMGALLMISLAQAQMIVLKDNTQLGTESFRVEGGKIFRIVKVGENESKTQLPANLITKMDWPDVEELTEANNLLAAGKTTEAVAVLKKGKEFFEPFEKVPGNKFTEIYMAYVDALSQSGAFEETLRAIPGLRLQKLNPQQQLKLKIIQLNIERQTSSDPKSIIAQAELILGETDDSAVAASLWGLIGDVHFKAKAWEEALMAYLHVPVFYGTQVQKVPEAELNSARCLSQMRRYEDASKYYQRLIDTYPGSGVAQTATKEMSAITGMKNEDPPLQAEK